MKDGLLVEMYCTTRDIVPSAGWAWIRKSRTQAPRLFITGAGQQEVVLAEMEEMFFDIEFFMKT